MKLSQLLNGLDFSLFGVCGEREIESICSDSRLAEKNGIFVCIKGNKRDGHDFARHASEKGSVVLSEKIIDGVPCVRVADTRLAGAVLHSNFFGRPQDCLRMIAVTGTNGKTSVAYYLRSILRTAGIKTGIMGTLGIKAENEIIPMRESETEDIPAAMTTPDPACIYAALYKMKNMGMEAVIMEASSHAIAQKKLSPIIFEAGAFTNLSPEHLDFHSSVEDYFKTKAALFERCEKIIVNTDSVFGKRLIGIYPRGVSVSTRNAKELCSDGGRIAYKYKDLNISATYSADFTLENTVLAAETALQLGIDKIYIEKGIASVENIPGRMEHIVRRDKYGFDAYVDYAHTPYAMERVLRSVCKYNMGKRVTAVFGCGGDRDRSKRPEMGRIASMYADRVIVTGDNPRTEDPMAIIGDILSGISDKGNVTVIPDRRKAIETAVHTAEKDEIILLLGKGHEEYEIDKNGKHSFSERDILLECAERGAK